MQQIGKGPSKIQDDLAAVLSKLFANPNGRALATVLKQIEADIAQAKVIVSSDMRRATFGRPNGKLATVRVTVGKPINLSNSVQFRFKTPVDLQKYEYLYFGGLGARGTAVIHKLKPNDIGHLKTITLRGA